VVRPHTADLEALLRGSLNRRECAACGQAFVLDAPVVFRDDETPCLIYFLPEADAGRRARAAGEMAGLAATAFAEAGNVPPVCRIAFTRRQFIEKVALHLRGLDDRLIEYIKYQMFRNPQQKVSAASSELFYDFSPGHSDRLSFLVFERGTGAATGVARLPLTVYDELAAGLAGDGALGKELGRLFPGPHVNVEDLLA